MNKIFKVVLILIAIAWIAPCASNSFAATPYAMIIKFIWYSQTNPTALILDPVTPYEFSASVTYDKSVTNIVSAELLGPFGIVPMSKALSFGNNSTGVGYDQYFQDKASLDGIYKSGTNKYIFTVKFPNSTNYFTNQFNNEVYAPLPIITAANNCNWSPSGYIMPVDSSKPFTISWPGGANIANMSTIITINSIGNFTGLGTNFSNSAQFTFSTNLISQLPKGVVIPISISVGINPSIAPWGNGFATYNRFSIFIPPSLTEMTPFTAGKRNILVQTNNSDPLNFTPPVGSNGVYVMWDYSPYNFGVTSPLPCSFTNPAGKAFTNRYNGDSYGYSGGAMTKVQMDSTFPNGLYSFSTGQKLNLTGDNYPAAAKILSVNGVVPTWEKGMLLLNPTKNNTISWSAYSNSISFANAGLEFVDMSCTDYSDLSGNYGSFVNLVICPPAGLGGTLPQTSLLIPAGKLKANVNYLLHVGYGSLSSLTNAPVLSGMGYSRDTYIRIIAK
jgi:hypothetical protein